jgi:tetratricopeptide (TPR) repeat protein
MLRRLGAFVPYVVLCGLCLSSGCNRKAPAPVQIDLPVDVNEVVELAFEPTDGIELDIPPSPAPIPTAPDHPVTADLNRRMHAYLAQDLERYDAHNSGRGKAAVAGREFLAALFASITRLPDALSNDELRKLGDAAIAAGSKDLSVRAHHLFLRLIADDLAAYDELNELLPKLETSERVSHFTRARAAHWLADKADEVNQSPRPAMRSARRIFASWLAADAVNKDVSPFVWTYYVDFVGMCDKLKSLDDQKRLLDECLKIPQVDPWFKHLAAGQYYLNLAWHYRGSETVQFVTPDGWQKFGQYLPIASKHLIHAWRLRPDLPHAATTMVTIAKAGGDPETSTREWFDRAVYAVMDWDQAYGTYIDSLLPRWGGSHRALIAFGKECAASQRYDTQVPYTLFSIVQTIEHGADGDAKIFENPQAYAVLAPMLEGYRDSPQSSERWKKWATVNYALISARTGHFEEARRTFDSIDAETLKENAQSLVKHQLLRNLAYAATGPGKEQVKQLIAKQLLDGHADEAAIREMKDWLAEARKLDNHEYAIRHFDELNTMLTWREKFLGGDWVNLTFNKNMDGWNFVSRGADKTMESETAIVLSSRKIAAGGIVMESLMKFHPPFEIEVDIEQLPPLTLPTIGLHIGDSQHFEGEGRYFVIMQHAGAAGRFVFGERDLGGFMKLRQVNRMRLKVWQGYWEQSVNNAFYYPGLEPNFRTDGRVAFGDYGEAQDVGEVRFSNLRIRSLPYGKPPSVTTSAVGPTDLVKYYESVVEHDPDDAFAHLYLASSYLSTEQMPKAVQAVERCEALIDQQEWISSGLRTVQGMLDYQSQRYQDAWDKFREVLPDQRQAFGAQAQLVWLLAASPDEAMRDGETGVQYAKQALVMSTTDQWWYEAALAAAHAEVGDFEQAIELQKQAIDGAPESQKAGEHERLLLYEAGKPFRLEQLKDSPDSTRR